MRRARPLAALAAGLASLLGASAARADLHEWQVAGVFGFATLDGGPRAAGYGGGAHLSYGFTDTFSALATFDATMYPQSHWLVTSTGLGATWLVDTLRWVPWVGGVVGPAWLAAIDPNCGLSLAEPCRAFRLSLAVPVGLDYRVTPRLSVGVTARLQLLLLGEAPWTTIGASAKVGWSFGR